MNMRPIFPPPGDVADRLIRCRPEFSRQTLAEAGRILKREIPVFPGITARANGRIDWRRDPVSGKRWRVFRGKPFIAAAHADIKFVWELNRHQYLAVLGKAFALTRDKSYARAIEETLIDWIDNNPAGFGINYRSGLEVSLRLISWIWSLHFLSQGTPSNADADKRIQDAIFYQADFIHRNLQSRPCPNNHLIGEAAGLFICATAFPAHPRSPEWGEKGMRILVEQLRRQVAGDGVDREQAWDYHRFVLDLYTIAAAVSAKTGLRMPAEALRTIEMMHEALLRAMRPDRMMPMIGDDDSGRALKLSASCGRDPGSAFSTGAVLFKNPVLKWAAQKIHEETLWLLGAESAREFDALESRPPAYSSTAMEESGQYIMRSGWEPEAFYLYYDCGPQGMGEAGHGHADALSIEVHAHGSALLIDPGTYIYNGSKRWRNFFRGTAAHTTLLADGKDQAVPIHSRDPFGWNKKADGKPLAWHCSAQYDFVSGSHNGYDRLPSPLRHQRDILFVKPRYWIVSDILHGKGIHSAKLFFHAAPAMEADFNGNGRSVRIRDSAGNGLLLIPAAHKGLRGRIINGSTRPVQGWVSYSYGAKVKSPVVIFALRARAPMRLDTVLFPFSGGAKPDISVTEMPVTPSSSGARSRALEIRHGAGTDYFLHSPENGEKTFGPFTSDAHQALISLDPDGAIRAFFLRNATCLFSKGECLLKNPAAPDAISTGIADNGVIRVTHTI